MSHLLPKGYQFKSELLIKQKNRVPKVVAATVVQWFVRIVTFLKFCYVWLSEIFVFEYRECLAEYQLCMILK